MSAYLNSNGSSYSWCLLGRKLHKVDVENLLPWHWLSETHWSQYVLSVRSSIHRRSSERSGRDCGPCRGGNNKQGFPLKQVSSPWLSVPVVEEMASFLLTKENWRAEVQVRSGSHCGWNSECSQLGCFFKKKRRLFLDWHTAAPCSWGPNELVESKGFQSLWKRWYAPTCYHKSLKQ